MVSLKAIILLLSTISTATAQDRKAIGDTCDKDNDKCYETIQGLVQCKLKADEEYTCQCGNGFTGINGEYFCRRIVTDVGGKCVINEQCNDLSGLGRLSRCQNESCECFDTYYPDAPYATWYNPANRKCEYVVPTEEPEIPAELRIGSACDQNNDRCRDSIVGEVSCKIQDVQQECQCDPGHTGENGESYCRKIAKAEGDECAVKEQCIHLEGLGALSRCQNSKCECFDTESPANPKDTSFNPNTRKCEHSSAGRITLSLISLIVGLFITKLNGFQ